MKEDQDAGEEISGDDFNETSDQDAPLEGDEWDEQTIQVYKHKASKKGADREDMDEEIDLGDIEKLAFGGDFLEVNGEHIHKSEYFGDEWTKHIVSLASAFLHVFGYLVLTRA